MTDATDATDASNEGGPTRPEEAWRAATAEADGCRACPLWENATQTVFGEGPVPAEMMLVGEQPGDREDVEGQPFVGPAGRVLDEALGEVGIVRCEVYVTNAVKHFKWKPRGKRRLHQTPDRAEVAACRPWLERELALVQPRLLVLLGATAAKAELGPGFRVTVDRGRPMSSLLVEHVVANRAPLLDPAGPA